MSCNDVDGGAPARLPALSGEGQPGVSVVTGCRNRNENLVRALPSWLAQAEVSEVVIVDWSSTVPVAHTLCAAGIADPRVRIVRVEGETRWALSLAFNAGFRAASCCRILKLDADIVLAADFFGSNPLPADGFIAGNWQSAGTDQKFINGSFLVERRHLAAVGGYNEYIRTYGWDDGELYRRLTGAGLRRHDVAPGSLIHIAHDDSVRFPSQDTALAASAAAAVIATREFMILRNRRITEALPPWTDQCEPALFHVLDRYQDMLTLRRGLPDPSEVPPDVAEQAYRSALIEAASRRYGRELTELDPLIARRLLDLPEARLSRIEVLLARSGQADWVFRPGGFVVLRCAASVLQEGNAGWLAALKDLCARIRASGRKPLVQTDWAALPPQARGTFGDAAFLGTDAPIGPFTPIAARAVYDGTFDGVLGTVVLGIGERNIGHLSEMAQRHPTRATA